MQKVKVIAEIGLSHEGSLGTAMAYVKAIARTGAYAVKFQTHIAEYESSINERFRTNIFPQTKQGSNIGTELHLSRMNGSFSRTT